MLVSVIIPCYNVQNYIEECIESVINQTYKNIEIICVDNNSNDDTWEELKKIKNTYPHIILEKELNAGANYARNKGLFIAKGVWIQFLDADDLLDAEKINHQINLISTNNTNNIAFVAGAWKKKNIKGEVSIVNNLSTETYLAPFINKAGNTCSNLWSITALRKINLWDVALKSSQEADLMLRLVTANFNFFIDESPLTIVREREVGQISQGNSEKKWVHFINIRLKYLLFLRTYNVEIYEKYSPIYYDFLMVSLFSLARHNVIIAKEIFCNEIKPYWKTANTYGFNSFKFFLINLLGLKLYTKFFLHK